MKRGVYIITLTVSILSGCASSSKYMAMPYAHRDNSGYRLRYIHQPDRIMKLYTDAEWKSMKDNAIAGDPRSKYILYLTMSRSDELNNSISGYDYLLIESVLDGDLLALIHMHRILSSSGDDGAEWHKWRRQLTLFGNDRKEVLERMSNIMRKRSADQLMKEVDLLFNDGPIAARNMDEPKDTGGIGTTGYSCEGEPD